VSALGREHEGRGGTVELRSRAESDEELAAVGILSGITHSNLQRRRVRQAVGGARRQGLLTTPLSENFCCSPAFSSLKVPPHMLCKPLGMMRIDRQRALQRAASHLAARAVLENEISAL
jgi:hypothetical protein